MTSNTTLIASPTTASLDLSNNAYMLSAASLVFIMTPGIGLFYSGLVRGKNALALIFVSIISIAVVTMQWFFFGFSLTFSDNASPVIGNFDHAVLINIGAAPMLTALAIPATTYVLYQLQFAAITPAIIFGSVADRIKLVPSAFFIFCWTTLVYDVVAYWTWGHRGWLRNLSCLSTTALNQVPCGIGQFDFAGGGPVHIASGFAGLAYSLFLGKRTKRPISGPANLTMVFIGTSLIWFGWYGFNGGSSGDASARSSMAALVTTISASFASMTWLSLDFFYTKKLSGVGMCMGAISGLVTITPASGFVAPWAGAIIGAISGFTVNYFSRLKEKIGFDDTLDAFGIHGVAGILGSLLVGIFHQSWIPALGGQVTKGGAIEGNWTCLGYQTIGVCVVAVYSFVMSYLILFVIDLIPGMSLKGVEIEADENVDLEEISEKDPVYVDNEQ